MAVANLSFAHKNVCLMLLIMRQQKMLIVALIVLMMVHFLMQNQHINRSWAEAKEAKERLMAKVGREAEAQKDKAQLIYDQSRKYIYDRSGTTKENHKKKYPKWDKNCEDMRMNIGDCGDACIGNGDFYWQVYARDCKIANGYPTQEKMNELCQDESYRKRRKYEYGGEQCKRDYSYTVGDLSGKWSKYHWGGSGRS
jgi:hypothetical protein